MIFLRDFSKHEFAGRTHHHIFHFEKSLSLAGTEKPQIKTAERRLKSGPEIKYLPDERTIPVVQVGCRPRALVKN